jgi:hypothetical protein
MEDAILQRRMKAEKESHDNFQRYLKSKDLLEKWVKQMLIEQRSNILKAIADGYDNYSFKTHLSKDDFDQMKALYGYYRDMVCEDKINCIDDISWCKEYKYISDYTLRIPRDIINSVDLDSEYMHARAYAYPKLWFYNLKKVKVVFEITFRNINF